MLDLGEEGVQGLGPQVALLSMADRHGAFGRFAIPHHEHVRDLLELGVTNLGVDLLVSEIEFNPETKGVRPVADGRCIVLNPVCDGKNGCLLYTSLWAGK